MVERSLSKALRGAAALKEMLDVIGDDKDDHAVAKILVSNELELGELLDYTVGKVREEL